MADSSTGLDEPDTGNSIISYAAPEDSPRKQTIIRLVERLSGKQRIVRAYFDARRALQPGDDIFALAMRVLDLKVTYNADGLRGAPATGPLVVVANHPFGVIDGLALCFLVSLVRSDFKVVAMSTLCRVPEIREHVLPINFAETRDAMQMSARSRRMARQHLEDGGCLVIFPAGAVSTSPRFWQPAVDAPWHPFAARLISATRAAVMPVRFEGQNSILFQLVSRFSQTLRLSLLMQEAARRIGGEVEARVGRTIPYDALPAFDDPKELASHLRALTYAL